MHIYLGSDHGGFRQKELLLAQLEKDGQHITDCGTYSKESTDYPDFAIAVGTQVMAKPGSLGVLLCRSGEGMEMAANKIKGIRAALVWDVKVASETRRDNDANILVLPSDFITDEQALEIVATFIATPFSGEERHIHRLQKLHHIERTLYYERSE